MKLNEGDQPFKSCTSEYKYSGIWYAFNMQNTSLPHLVDAHAHRAAHKQIGKLKLSNRFACSKLISSCWSHFCLGKTTQTESNHDLVSKVFGNICVRTTHRWSHCFTRRAILVIQSHINKLISRRNPIYQLNWHMCENHDTHTQTFCGIYKSVNANKTT